MARGKPRLGHRALWRRAAPGLAVLMTLVPTGLTPARASVGPANTVGLGLPPVAIAVDAAAHTAYVVTSDSGNDDVAVVNTAACTAHPSSTCSGAVATVSLEAGAGADGVAFDPANNTVYVADAATGDVSMIDAKTCSAEVTTGCATAPAIGMTGLASPSAVAVDTAGRGDVVYVADRASGEVTVFSGTACRATVATGCATTSTVVVGAAPDAIAVASAIGTVYVGNSGDDNVSTINESACLTMSAGCSTVGRTVPLGPDESPVAMVADPADATVFIAEAGTGDVSFLDTSHCTIAITVGCSATPRVMSGLGAAGIGMTDQGDVTVADSLTHRVISFNAPTCDATTTTGCTSQEIDVLGGEPGVLATSGVTVYTADAGHDDLDIVATPSMVLKITTAHRLSPYGWYRSPVTVGYVCTAGTAALASKCPGSVTVAKNTAGRSFGGALISDDGGRVTAGTFVRVDMTKPKLKVIGVVNGKRYPKGHHPYLQCLVSDALSGVASCAITRVHRGFHGRHVTYTGIAYDKAGNVTRVHGGFRLS